MTTPDAHILDSVRFIGAAITDPWFIVDDQERILEFNSAFYALFSRSVARNLKKLRCSEIGNLPGCGTDHCLRQRCVTEGAFRLDELEALIDGQPLRMIISSAPLPLDEGKVGAIIVLRNVTDEAKIQLRYQSMVADAEAQRRQLVDTLEQRNRQLIAATQEVDRLELELQALRKLEPG